jgi:hypothetical protein
MRRGINFSSNPDVTSIDIDPGRELRSDADITLQSPKSPLRILAVHLKTGCFGQQLTGTMRRTCAEPRQQIPPLLDWLSPRRTENVAFAIRGDFTRHMDQRDRLWSALRQVAPLATRNRRPHLPLLGWRSIHRSHHRWCCGTGSDAANALRVLTYRETGAIWKQHLSDHCPASARLRIPD